MAVEDYIAEDPIVGQSVDSQGRKYRERISQVFVAEPKPFERNIKFTAPAEDEFYEDPFVGDSKASFQIQHESARHRLCVYLAAEGHTIQEIAAKTEYCAGHVGTILRQPWAKARLTREIREAGQTEIKKLLSTVGMASLERLKSLAESDELKVLNPKIYYDANVNLVDRFLGKPNQPVTTEHKTSKALSDEELAARIDERLKSNQPN